MDVRRLLARLGSCCANVSSNVIELWHHDVDDFKHDDATDRKRGNLKQYEV